MRRRIQYEIITLLAILALLATGCASQKYTAKYPGALDDLDAHAYEALGIAQAALNQAKAEVATGSLSASAGPLVDKVGAVYNSTRDSWLFYRGVKSGKQTGDLQGASAALNANVGLLNDAVAQLKLAIKGGH